MAYEPNLTDNRVKKRIHTALGMAVATLRTDKPKALGKRFIDKHFGQQQTKLAKWLRKQLLETTCHLYDYTRGYCKQYKLKESGVKMLSEVIGVDYDLNPESAQKHIITQWANAQYKTQFENGFEYEDKSYRLWNPLQNIKSETRHQLLAENGYEHVYDIATAAPTLLYQLYLKRGGERLSHIDDYITNKSSIRSNIASKYGMELKAVKRTINAMFAGATLSCNKAHSLFRELNYNYNLMNLLQTDEFFVGLSIDLKAMWNVIKTKEEVRYKYDNDLNPVLTKTGKHRVERFTSSRKWGVYFREERLVGDCIRIFLATSNTKFFYEHDGFSSNKEVDISELQKFIKKETGYELNFDYEFIGIRNTDTDVFEYK